MHFPVLQKKEKPLQQLGFQWFYLFYFFDISGETGIRTLGPREGSTVFETAPIDHSGISPVNLHKERYCYSTKVEIISFVIARFLHQFFYQKQIFSLTF